MAVMLVTQAVELMVDKSELNWAALLDVAMVAVTVLVTAVSSVESSVERSVGEEVLLTGVLWAAKMVSCSVL